MHMHRVEFGDEDISRKAAEGVLVFDTSSIDRLWLSDVKVHFPFHVH